MGTIYFISSDDKETNNMTEFPAVLLSLGVALLLVGLVGKVKTRDMEVGTENKTVRFIVGSIGAAFIALSLFQAFKPAPPAGETKIFPYPTSDSYRVDWCYDSTRGCGQTAANEFCKRQGLIQAVDFTQDPNVGKEGIVTKELGTGELCSSANCDAFKSITCQ
jgi:hypothetical protein